MPNAQMFDINFSAMESLTLALGASHNQYVGAYNRALNRTAKYLHKASMSMMLEELAVKKRSTIKRRVRPFITQRNSGAEGKSFSGLQLSSAKIWYGLNPFRVHELRGQMKAQRRVKQPRDPSTGRYLNTKKGARGSSFMPKGKGLMAQSFADSFVAERYGFKSIWIRHDRGGIEEARVDVAEPVEDAIDDYIFDNIGPVFWKFFEQDLRGRVAGNVHFDPKSGKRT